MITLKNVYYRLKTSESPIFKTAQKITQIVPEDKKLIPLYGSSNDVVIDLIKLLLLLLS